jgi:Ca-activated chloride channel family protein
MISFEWPLMSLLLLVPFLVWALARLRTNDNEELPIRYPYLSIIEGSYGTSGKTKHSLFSLFQFFLYLIWALIVVSLMRPQYIDQLTQTKSQGYDIILAVDLSGSMRALDFSNENQRLNRLDVAKIVVGKFVQDRANDRVGLVLFGDFAYQYAPLTFDTIAVSKMLNDTFIGMAGDGTSIGDAIGLSVRALRDKPERSRVIILLTDGEDTASSVPPLQAAKLAKNYNIKIYTVGIGSKGHVPFPDRFGNISMVQTSIDEQLLNDIAELTQGLYYRATNLDALKDVYNEIDKLEPSESISKRYLKKTPLYIYPLLVAAILFLLLSVVPFIKPLMMREV